MFFILLLGVVLLAAACSGDSEEVEPSPTTTPTSAPTKTPIAVTGLFTEIRDTTPDEFVQLGEQPPSQFEPWDGESTMLYDRISGTARNLGQGTLGAFSPGGTWMGWSAGPPYEFDTLEAWVIALETLEQQALGKGSFIRFLSENEALIQVEAGGQGLFRIVDLVTGERRPPDTAIGLDQMLQQKSAIHGLRTTSNELDRRTGLETADGQVLLTFNVWRAAIATADEIVLMTIPESDNTNIFLVDIATGEASFVASSPITRIANHPLTANEKFVIWTDDYCNFTSPGRTRVYDRRTGRIMELDERLWVSLTSDGLIASGVFGAKTLIDPETFEYVFVLPAIVPGFEGQSSGPDVSWSPDYRYASRGFAGGRGACT